MLLMYYIVYIMEVLCMDAIYAVYGTDGKGMALQALRAMGAASLIPSKDSLIAIKPNVVNASPPRDGATTHPEVVAGIIEYLHENGYMNIEIIESAWAGANTKSAYRAAGYEQLTRDYGVPLYDLKKDKCTTVKSHGLRLDICNRALAADFFINVPVLKAHCQTLLTCALKNLKGIIPDAEKRRYHTLGIHEPVAKLASAFRQHLVVVDGLCGDLTFEEGGNPVEMNRLIISTDAMAIDSYCAALIGYRPDEIGYLKIARQLGVGGYYQAGVTPLVEINKAGCTAGKSASRKAARLAEYIDEDCACSSCYASLIHALNRLDDDGLLRGLKPHSIHIGQGNRGIARDGIGIGTCCAGYMHNAKGCPPDALAIAGLLRGLIKGSSNI